MEEGMACEWVGGFWFGGPLQHILRDCYGADG